MTLELKWCMCIFGMLSFLEQRTSAAHDEAGFVASYRKPSAFPASPEELPARSMHDSYDQVVIPFRTNPEIRQSHISAKGRVRHGRLLEDMDTFAVWIAYRHIQYPLVTLGEPIPVTCVTALVDDIRSPDHTVDPEEDLILRGHVSWTGSSSLEITMECVQFNAATNVYSRILSAKFVMVARKTSAEGGKAFVNPLTPEGEEEHKIFRDGEESRKLRHQFASESLLREPPTREERRVLHDLFLKHQDPETYILKSHALPDNAIWMTEARFSNVIVCHPEFRNIYNKIFGGFLMRVAFELAWALVFTQSGHRPALFHTEDIRFQRPVNIGDILHLDAYMIYSERNLVQTEVNATVIEPETGSKKITNTFHFLFKCQVDEMIRIMPRTYLESILYLQGRRYMHRALTLVDNN